MIETHGKILITTFIALLIGLIFIQAIATDVELVKVGSITILNESVALTAITANVVNETVTLSDGLANKTGTLANNHLTTLTALRNFSSEVITNYCNITLATGVLSCNDTGNYTAYADYTYNDYSTGQLSSSYDEWLSFDACRNSTMDAIEANLHCNLTIATGAVRVNYDNFTDDLAYIDYKYEPDTYVHNSAARTILTVTVLLFAVGILLVGVGYAWKSFKESDMS